jgi:putative transposase
MDSLSFFVTGRVWRLFVSHSHLSSVISYIRNQENHHRRKSFQREYLEFLIRHEVPHDERFIFKPIE